MTTAEAHMDLVLIAPVHYNLSLTTANTVVSDLITIMDSSAITTDLDTLPIDPAPTAPAHTTANTVVSDLIITMASSAITTDLDTLLIDPAPTAPAHITANTVESDLIITMDSSAITTDLDTLRIDPAPTHYTTYHPRLSANAQRLIHTLSTCLCPITPINLDSSSVSVTELSDS